MGNKLRIRLADAKHEAITFSEICGFNLGQLGLVFKIFPLKNTFFTEQKVFNKLGKKYICLLSLRKLTKRKLIILVIS